MLLLCSEKNLQCVTLQFVCDRALVFDSFKLQVGKRGGAQGKKKKKNREQRCRCGAQAVGRLRACPAASLMERGTSSGSPTCFATMSS